jgi:hypothetical protein
MALNSQARNVWPSTRDYMASRQDSGRLAGTGTYPAGRQEAARLAGTGPGVARVYRPRASAARCCTQRRTDG